MRPFLRIACALAAVGVGAGAAGVVPAGAQGIDQADIAAAIERFVALSDSAIDVPGVGPLREPAGVRAFYAARGHGAVWHVAATPSAAAAELARLVDGAATEGLYPVDYHAGAIDRLLRESARSARARDAGAAAAERAAALDLALTDAFFTMAEDRARGRVDPAALPPRWTVRPARPDAARLLEETLEAGSSLAAAFASLDPVMPEYVMLRAALADYRAVDQAGGWPAVPAQRTLRAGDTGPDVALLRARLAAEPGLGPSSAVGASGTDFDAHLDAALREFQRRHSLDADGVVGPRTRAALNVTARGRAEQIELAMERLRWLSRELPATRIVVSVPAFTLEAVRPGEPSLRMRVVGGLATWPTPVLIDAVEQVSFRPYWNVPQSIVAAEVLPGMRRDPGYATRHDFEVRVRAAGELRTVDPATIDWSAVRAADRQYLFRQRPGPANPLGLVKFVMPDADAIALHDTPGRAAFEESLRAASHGCVRVEQADRLAEWLLAGQGWSADDVRKAMNADTSSLVDLIEPVQTLLLYSTAWIDAGGALRFAPDIYGRDASLARALRARGGHGGVSFPEDTGRMVHTEDTEDTEGDKTIRVRVGPPAKFRNYATLSARRLSSENFPAAFRRIQLSPWSGRDSSASRYCERLDPP